MSEGASRSRLSLRPATSPSCLYCKEPFDEGEPIFACEGCGVGYHRDCMRDELGRCATLGCDGRRAMPTRAKAPLDPIHRSRLQAAFGDQPGVTFAPFEPALEQEVRKRLARGASADETLLAIVRDLQRGAPVAAFSDQAAYIDFSGGQQARRLPLDQLESLEHRHSWLHVTVRGEGPRMISLGVHHGALRRYLDEVIDRPWKTGQGYACDACLVDFDTRQPFVECRACGACQHEACARAEACPGASCAGGELVKRLAPAYFLGADTSPTSSGCPACVRGLNAGDPTLTCEGCQAVYHTDCLRGLGHCATRGCQGRRATPGRQPRSYGALLLVGAVLLVVVLLGVLAS